MKLTSLRSAIVLSLFAAGAAHATTTNLVTNGSFEADKITNSAGWEQVSSVTGWNSSVSGNDAFELQKGANQGGQGGFIANAADGTQYLELNTDQLTSIGQAINTSSATDYTLSFSYAGRPDTPNGATSSMQVYWGRTLVDTVSAVNGVWTTASLTVSSTSDLTALIFKSTGPTSATSFGSYLDNVSVTALPTAVPEPGTYAMLLAGLGMIGFTASRSKAKAKAKAEV